MTFFFFLLFRKGNLGLQGDGDDPSNHENGGLGKLISNKPIVIKTV